MKSKNVIPNRIIFVLYNIVMSICIWLLIWGLLNTVFYPSDLLGFDALAHVMGSIIGATLMSIITPFVSMYVQYRVLRWKHRDEHMPIFAVNITSMSYACIVIAWMAIVLSNIALLIFMITLTLSLVAGASYLYVHQNSPQREKAKRI
ncbi:MAG: hypothetical protein AAFV98_16650 [Chloroflexota bacterium]